MHGGGTPQSTSQELSVPTYVRKKALNPRRKAEYGCSKMMGKSPGVQFGIQFPTWNVGLCWESGVKHLRLSKDIVLIFAVCRK